MPDVAVIGFSLLLMHLNLRDIGEYINLLLSCSLFLLISFGCFVLFFEAIDPGCLQYKWSLSDPLLLVGCYFLACCIYAHSRKDLYLCYQE